MIGKQIAHYKITAKIGEGGMGEVYRATDTKLNRDVALKILPEQFSADAQRMGRFQREAEVLASLDHPNIGAIHGIEDVGDTKALVLQLIEGPTLADRIAEGPIPIDEALPIALQIAEALEGAHQKGIIHRDLKPANIKITPEGQVKVLDFGLAKAMEPERGAASGEMTQSPTLSMAATQAGLILGTAAYMSPEQARGKATDRRADIWSFGVVFYEMLSGRKPFPGGDLAETLARVIEREPDWDALPSGLSPAVKAFLRRCLAKEPRQRIHDIADMRLAIEGAFETRVEGASSPDRPWGRGALPWSIAVAAIVVAVAVGVSGNWDRNETPVQPPLRRFSIETVEGTTLPRGVGRVMAVSPDGETIVYVGDSSDGRRLFRRSLAQHEATPIQGTEGATEPFFSPDGQWVGFTNNSIRAIKRVPFSGGEPFTICTQCSAGFWGDDGNIVFEWEGTVFRVPGIGGQSEVLVKPMPESGVAAMNGASLLPGSRAVLFEIGAFEFGGVGVFSLESHDLIVITDNGSDPSYSPTGHVLFARDDTLLAVPFDLERFQMSGQPTPVLSGVRVENGGAVQAALSRDGLLVYAAAADETGSQLVWVDRNGRVESVLEEGRAFYGPRISPDGQQIAVQINAGGKTDIWLHQSGTLRPLTNTGKAANPIWAPDGRTITFSFRSAESFAIQTVSSDGGGKIRTLLSSDSPIVPEAWSLDGTRLIFLEGGSDLFVTDVRDPGSRAPYAVSSFSEHAATLSPSGNWVAYVSDQTGSNEVYVRPFPGPGRERRISRRGGQAPSWGRDDSELMFRSPDDRHLLNASLQFDPFQVQQTVLFSAQQYWAVPGRTHYDVDPDGRRLLMLNQRDSNSGRSKLRVVESWFTELERLVPAEN